MVTEGDVHDVIDAGLERLDSGERPIGRRLARTYEAAYANVEADLELVVRRIGQAIEDGEDVNPDWLRREARYRQLLENIEREYALAGQRAGLDVADLQRLGADRGYRTGAGLLDATFGPDHPPTIGLATGNVPVDALERFVSATEPGTPLQRLLAATGERAASVVETEIANGIAAGYAPGKIAARIFEQLAGVRSRADIARLVRTESMRAFRGGLADSFKPFEHLGIGYRWVAAKSTRTCLSCLFRDGQITKEPPTQQHMNCRCTFNLVPAKQYASLSGFFETGEQWLNRQSAETQRSMFPSDESFNAYRKGSVDLKDFSGYTHSAEWGGTFYERSGTAALVNAGIPLRL